jgi:hypothetical protein
MNVRGWPSVTISRGEIVAKDGEVSTLAGRGLFLLEDRIPGAKTERFAGRLEPRKNPLQ